MNKYDPNCYDQTTPAEAKKLLENFAWNYVVLADAAQDDEFYAEARAGLEQQEKKLKEIAKSA